MINENDFWDSTVDEMAQGFRYEPASGLYQCLLCDYMCEDGIIYKQGEFLLEAKKAIVYHIKDKHHSSLDSLLGFDKKYTGLTEQQRELIRAFYDGLSDKEVAEKLGIGSVSTVRNHRFKLKEKEKQAKVFLAIMKSLLEKDEDKLVSVHKGAKMVDERYITTEQEKEKILSTYFKEGVAGPLAVFPSKEKRKIIVLQQITNRFERKKVYTEKEVSEILKRIYPDFATIRRYLIEYGFMERNKDGLEYWLK
ncbi:DUF2087 domain-containing protein [Alkalihalobacillus sp. 1P02AB]|uniref:DUF2087 domain-containing protein n=1 Tax=Alkalihalobacillus sp. 1P02AB TaxID=3132260 RepID=UPI0039A5AA9F